MILADVSALVAFVHIIKKRGLACRRLGTQNKNRSKKPSIYWTQLSAWFMKISSTILPDTLAPIQTVSVIVLLELLWWDSDNRCGWSQDEVSSLIMTLCSALTVTTVKCKTLCVPRSFTVCIVRQIILSHVYFKLISNILLRTSDLWETNAVAANTQNHSYRTHSTLFCRSMVRGPLDPCIHKCHNSKFKG